MRLSFNLKQIRQTDGFAWEFKVPDKGEWKINAFAGIAGKTQGISVKYHNVRLSRRVP